MKYNYIKGKKNLNIKIFIVLMIVLAISLTGLIYGFKLIFSVGKNSSTIYHSILNNVIPITKIANSKVEMDNHGNVFDSVLQELNIKLFNPFKIIAFEVPFFNMNDFKVDGKNNFSIFDSFSLNENNIVKLNPEELQESKDINTSDIFNPKLKKTLNNSKPEVLIYHSHNEEHFSPAKKNTFDENFNIIGVGNLLTQELEKYGISVIHDKTLYKDYNNAYILSNKVVSKYLSQNKDFKLILDLHRDGGPSKNTVTTTLNGESVAKIMFVNSRNSKYYSKNAEFAEKMNVKAREIFPGFSRGIHTWKNGHNAFNQGLSPKSALIEVGSENSTAKEAQNSAKYIARIIAEAING